MGERLLELRKEGAVYLRPVALGILLVLSLSVPVAAQELALREVAATKGSAEVPFGAINDMLEIDDGRILVSDDVVGVVHAWDSQRDRVVRFARGGQGPGEVTVPSRMAANPHGGFGIYDIGASAVLLFDAEARPGRVVRYRGGGRYTGNGVFGHETWDAGVRWPFE